LETRQFKLTAFFLLAVFAVPACVVSEPTDYVIFTAQMALSQFGERPARTLGFGELPYFEPSVSSIGAFNVALSEYVRANSDVSLLDLVKYKIQFVGLTIEGKEALFANAFCHFEWHDDLSWRTRLVLFDDGGNCFFHAAYDLDTKAIIWLRINGHA
jgi:hypothetical protein